MDEKETRIEGIKAYIEDLFGQEDQNLVMIKENCQKANLPMIHVPPHVGKLLNLILQLKKPNRVLEIGTLVGYSTIWMARALPPGGKIFTIDSESHHLALAQEHAKLCGVEQKIVFIQGKALDMLDQMILNKEEKFDLVFVDADKENYYHYLQRIKVLLNDEAVILTDNLIPKWKPIGKPHPKDMMAKSIYAYNEALVQDPQLDSAMISTLVGEIPRIDGLGISIYRRN